MQSNFRVHAQDPDVTILLLILGNSRADGIVVHAPGNVPQMNVKSAKNP
jgi:hypothetical protein